MFECLILGDSTGVGTAQAINARYERHCDVQAAERATAAQVLSWRRPGKRYNTCIFSMGSMTWPDRLSPPASLRYVRSSASTV
jgi:hypothetical protein